MKTITEAKTRAKTAPRKKSVRIRLDPAIHQQAEQFAKAEKRTLSQYVQFVLEQYLMDQSRHEQQTSSEHQELAAHIQQGETHGVWSAYDEFKAAEQLQALLKNVQP